MFPKLLFSNQLKTHILITILPALLVPLLLLCFIPPLQVMAQATPVANPDLTARCGQDIILAIDESGSFQGFESTMRFGAQALLDLLADTGSRVALVEFNLDARTPLGATYLPVTAGPGGTISPGGPFDLYLKNNYQPNGNTNWDAALHKIEEINRTQGVAPLVIFLTDGQPNAYVNQFGSILAGDVATSVAEAIPAANLVKMQGSHIFAVGIGAGLAEKANLIAIADADPYPVVTLRSGQADYLMTTLGGLENMLRQLIFDLCGASLSVIKRENLGDGQGYVLKSGQLFTATVGITENGQPNNAYTWLEPVPGAAGQVGTSQPLHTNGNGVARWQWLPGSQQSPQQWPAQVTLAEAPQANTTVVSATCVQKYIDDNNVYQANTMTITPFPATLKIGAYELVTCDVRNAQLGISVQKSATPSIVPETGGDVIFTFVVANNSTVSVRLTALNDSVFGNLHNQGDCVAGGFNVVGAGETYRCSVTKRLAGNAGTPHQNSVTATVVDANQHSVTALATATVNFSDALPPVTLSRSAAPVTLSEPGGLVVYSLQLTNNSAGEPATVTGLRDTPYDNVTAIGGSIQSTTCVLPQTLALAGQPGATYNCNFTVQLSGPPDPYTDTLTATVSDDDGNTQQLSKDQLVTISNAPPAATLTITPAPVALPEPGGIFVFTVAVANTSPAEALTLSALTDSRYGNISAVGGLIAATTCTLPQTLAPAGQAKALYQCTFTTEMTGAPGLYPNTLRATVGDDEGGVLQVERESAVEITDIPASLLVTKRAARTSLPEPGGPMTFSITVVNTSPVDQVRLTHVLDDQFGDVSSTCSPALPIDLAPQQQLGCLFVRPVTGAVGDRHINEVTAVGVDDDGKPVTDRDQEFIEITDLPALLDIIQSATPANLPEPGGIVTFTALIKNISAVDTVRIDKVETNNAPPAAPAFTEINRACVPAIPALLAPGEQLRCAFTKLFTGPVGARHVSEVVATGVDDEGLPIKQTGREAVDIVDVPSALRVTKSANPVSVPETGGMVAFAVQVQNISQVDTVTLTTLVNSQFGPIDDTCTTTLPVILDPGATLDCTFIRLINGDTGTIVSQRTTATGMDDDGNAVSDDAVVTIGIIDTPASIKVVQLTTPTSIPEPGGDVTFTIAIQNSSSVDTVTIQHVKDSRLGDISTACTPALPASLAPQTQLTCRLVRTLTGDAGTTFASTVSVTGVDDDGQIVTDFDLVNLDVTDVAPQLLVDMAAAPNQVLESGGLVTFTVFLRNNGPELITVESLIDADGSSVDHSHLSPLQADADNQRVQVPGTCLLPQTLAAAGGTYTCTFSKLVTGSHTQPYRAVVTASAVDNEGNRSQVADEADVFLIAVSPDLVLTKRDFLVIDHFTSEQDRGQASPGDRLGYEIVVRNKGNGAATDVVLTDIPDANSTLTVGSVQTSKGVIALGNSAKDWLAVIDIGDMASGEQVTITLQVTVTEGAGATLLRNQATVSQGITGAAEAGSDDPDTPFVGDPTDTTVVIPPTGLPPEQEPPINDETQRIFLPLIEQ